ncbi:MAG: putative rane protein [Anaerocolumna sp.]|jgi:hypothetical protein|nr:putative rane protein [Anaerocolumna sp.]
MNKTNSFIRQIRKILSNKKSRMTIYVLGVLWIAVIMQVTVNTFLIPKGSLLEAFVNTNSEVSSFELEMFAEYGADYLSEEDRKELVTYLASQIGLKPDKEAEIVRNGKETESYIEKVSKNANTLIKVISLEQENKDGVIGLKHYLIVKLKLYDNLDSILNYRKLIKATFKELGAREIETTMQLASDYNGKLSLDNMNLIADNMIKSLDGKIAYANREDELFTVYAYSGLLDEYVTSLDTKINMHVVISYDEESDTTHVYLGTPVINGGY